MKYSHIKIKLIFLIGLFLFTTACNGKEAPVSERSIAYTRIGECIETVENVNAAYSMLQCAKIGNYEVSIAIQAPVYFIVTLTGKLGALSTEFEVLSEELPLETGPAIEWHLINEDPTFMIYRLSWGTENDPFMMRERLVISFIANDRICVLATVDTKTNAKANEKARELIETKYISNRECPEVVEDF